ncbi:DUF4430 domain-containing protein [Candidatus Dojkabacteria bacterium]|uniref:DUF4430 domain-containing protein n=1 Tax=Candidatus Dojkabacteria bacterium TaxID=2099670 RepID=A0A955RHF1_9BACT|nr:DUF4430 domain-containing protein [Candidatus Dojkabacteria bacterium]
MAKSKFIGSKKFYVIGAVLIMLAFGCALVAELAFVKQSNNDNRSIDEVTASEPKQNVITEKRLDIYATEDGQNALELLKSSAVVEYDEFQFGAFVTTINNLKADSEHYWAFYVNGEYAEKGIDSTTLNKGDEISLVYEALDQ